MAEQHDTIVSGSFGLGDQQLLFDPPALNHRAVELDQMVQMNKCTDPVEHGPDSNPWPATKVLFACQQLF